MAFPGCLWHCAVGFLRICGECARLHLTLQVQEQNVLISSFYKKIFATISCQYIVEKL